MAVVAPLDLQRPAVEGDGDAPAGQAAPGGGDRGGAGAGAAGAGHAGAALADAQAQRVRTGQLRDADVGAFGEDRVVLELGPQGREVDGRRVLDEEDRMRVADVDRDRIAQGFAGELQVERVLFAGERDLVPAEARFAHVHRDPAGAGGLGAEQPGHGLDGDGVAAALAHDQGGGAAGAVAAGVDLAAVGVPEPQEDIGAAVARRLEHHDLVAADAGAPVGQRPRARVARREGNLPGVDHHEVVAQTVHLDEGAVAHDPGLYGLGGRKVHYVH